MQNMSVSTQGGNEFCFYPLEMVQFSRTAGEEEEVKVQMEPPVEPKVGWRKSWKNTWDHDLPWKKHDDLQIERTHGLDVSENSRFSPNHPYFHGVFNYFYHPFWGPTPILGNPHMVHHIWSVSIGYFSQFQGWDLWVFSCFGNMTSWKIHHLKMYFLLKVGDFPMSC